MISAWEWWKSASEEAFPIPSSVIETRKNPKTYIFPRQTSIADYASVICNWLAANLAEKRKKVRKSGLDETEKHETRGNSRNISDASSWNALNLPGCMTAEQKQIQVAVCWEFNYCSPYLAAKQTLRHPKRRYFSPLHSDCMQIDFPAVKPNYYECNDRNFVEMSLEFAPCVFVALKSDDSITDRRLLTRTQ